MTTVNELTARWASRLAPGPSVLSGAAVYPLLALLASAADGPARDELSAVVGPSPSDVVSLLAGSPSTAAALGVWSRPEVPLMVSSSSLVRGTLADQATLDEWASASTGGRIPRMPVALTPATLLVLAMAISISTRWTERFTDGSLRWHDQRWVAGLYRTDDDLDSVSVVDGDLTLATVRGADDVDVVLVLGAASLGPAETLPRAIRSLGGGVPGSALPVGVAGPGVTVRLRPAPAEELWLSLPRFRVDASHDLLDCPEVFGLGTATDDSTGHFPGLSPKPLAVSQARQEAMASFTAEGFEAAAVTAIAMTAGAGPPTGQEVRQVVVTIDRPFGFLAVHRATGTVLVAGWVTEPEARQAGAL